MTSWLYSRSCRTASIRSGRAGGLAGELANDPSNPKSVNELINRGIELILKTHGKALRRAA